ncbi:MAG TPA: DUF4097 family beta strand repeat-containing protein [Terriglobales bacterium]|nr:DUF4097 family beta strand repeat-containing protein [Terriglobales bacterium]
MKSARTLGLVVLLAAVAYAAPLQAEERGSFDRTLTVSGAVDLDVTSGSGNIMVHAGGSGTVHISATIRAKDNWLGGGLGAKEKVQRLQAHPPIEQQGNTIKIGRIEDNELKQNVSIDYDITTPAQTKLASHTGSGDQKISGLQQAVSANTGSGNVTLQDIGADSHIQSGSGDLRVSSIRGTLTAQAGSGNIRAEGIAGAITARTGSGEIELNQVAAGDVTAHAGSGNVKIRGVKGGLRADTGSGDIDAEGEVLHDWRLGAGSGNITLKVPSQASFNLDAHTGSGTLKVNHPVTMQGTMARNHIQGKVGNGGALLEVHTGSGNIHLD